MSSVPTLEECHETAGKLIALQSRRLVELAAFRSIVRRALTEKRHDGSEPPDSWKLDAIRKALEETK